MNSLMLAIKFLSVIPLPGHDKVEPRELGKSTAFFPFVGAFLGLIVVSIDSLFVRFLPLPLNNLFLIIALVLIRGGLHLDGLIDTADGIFSRRDRTKTLQIMKDSRIGTFGALALLSTILIKWEVLNHLTPELKWRLLILAPALSEWAVVYCTFVYPYARDEGMGKIFAQETGWLQFSLASTTAALLIVSLFKDNITVAFLLFLILVAGAAAYVAKRLQGFTGDSYGAVGELAEISAFLIFGLAITIPG